MIASNTTFVVTATTCFGLSSDHHQVFGVTLYCWNLHNFFTCHITKVDVAHHVNLNAIHSSVVYHVLVYSI
jgi:hypothetical protein